MTPKDFFALTWPQYTAMAKALNKELEARAESGTPGWQ